jgi:O-methyltransferase involved in polyketide biosynthesis
MDNVNKTLYIPLYGKAYVSSRGLLLEDKKAEDIWKAEGFPLKGKAKSRWLAYYMGMRSAVFDCWTEEQLESCSDAVVLHVGCGLDSRCIRVEAGECQWYDVDFPEVIAERKRYFEETESYHMIGSDIREEGWLSEIPEGKTAVIVMEGISMYLQRSELREVLNRLKTHFGEVRVLMDTYTVFAAKVSKYKNPINEVGVTAVYGLDDPKELEKGTGLVFRQEHSLTPDPLIRQLPGREQGFFRSMFAGKMAKKLYRLYEFH